MAQPPLSRAIRELERQLGVLLLSAQRARSRSRRPGKSCCGMPGPHSARSAPPAGRAQHAGEPTPRLRLALKADIDGGLLPRILDAYAREEAALPVELVLGRFGEQAQAVRDGRADTALLLGPFDDRGLTTTRWSPSRSCSRWRLPTRWLPGRACAWPTWQAAAFPADLPRTRAPLPADTAGPGHENGPRSDAPGAVLPGSGGRI
jgi:DNA-binding transcriptional LysR family regulator